MYLHRDDLKKINEIFEKFSDVDVIELTQDSSSGIGSYTSATFKHTANGLEGSFEVEVSGVEHW
jgi:hypothetical protein